MMVRSLALTPSSQADLHSPDAFFDPHWLKWTSLSSDRKSVV